MESRPLALARKRSAHARLCSLMLFVVLQTSVAPRAPSFGGMRDAAKQAGTASQAHMSVLPVLGDGNSIDGLDREAFVTLAATPDYVVGAEVVSRCLRHTGTSRPLLALVGDMLAADHIQRLQAAQYHILRVPPVLTAPTEPEYGRPLLNSTLLKLHLFGLKSYVDRLVYIDADVMPLQPLDHLFSLDFAETPSAPFAAAPEIMPPDKFNSGVLVVHPDDEVYRGVLSHAAAMASNEDQAVLNSFFPSWFALPAPHRLSFEHNVLQTVSSYYEPAWTLLRPRMKTLHFAGPRSMKPWSFEGSLSHSLAVYLYLWQSIARAAPGADIGPLFAVLAISDADKINALFQRRST